MRITTQVIQQRWLEDAQTRLNNLGEINQQIGSGKEVETPSDDPTGAKRILQLDEVLARNDQYLANINEAIHRNSTTETVLDQIHSMMVRVKSLAIEGANEASLASSASFAALREEVVATKNSVLHQARTKMEGEYIFNGTADEVSPYSDTGGPYLGDSNMLKVNLGSGQSVPLNLTGDRAFRENEVRTDQLFTNGATLTVPAATPVTFTVSDGQGVDSTITLSGTYDGAALAAAMNTQFTATGANLTASVVDDRVSIKFTDSELGGEMTFTQVAGDLPGTLGINEGVKNIFTLLDDTAAAMATGRTGEVSRLLDRIDRLNDNLANQRGQYGSRARNLSFARDRLEQYNLTNTTLKEQIEGVDLTEAVTRLNAGEQAYQAALAAGARIFNISILNFLR